MLEEEEEACLETLFDTSSDAIKVVKRVRRCKKMELKLEINIKIQSRGLDPIKVVHEIFISDFSYQEQILGFKLYGLCEER